MVYEKLCAFEVSLSFKHSVKCRVMDLALTVSFAMGDTSSLHASKAKSSDLLFSLLNEIPKYVLEVHFAGATTALPVIGHCIFV